MAALRLALMPLCLVCFGCSTPERDAALPDTASTEANPTGDDIPDMPSLLSPEPEALFSYRSSVEADLTGEGLKLIQRRYV